MEETACVLFVPSASSQSVVKSEKLIAGVSSGGWNILRSKPLPGNDYRKQKYIMCDEDTVTFEVS
jgi:hypothetical protein